MFGNGWSATISAEAPRVNGVGDGSTAVFATNGVTTLDTAGFQWPDVVGNVRIDQGWGYLGVSGALHRVAGQYYENLKIAHPRDKVRWAVQAAGQVRLPWGDTVGASFVYTKGAVGYATKAGSWQIYDGNSAAVGWLVDGLFESTNALAGPTGRTDIHLTNAWSVNAAFEHFWNPRWQTSVYGGYTRVWYDAEITRLINSHLPGAGGTLHCGVPVAGSVWPPVNVPTDPSNNSCSPNFSFFQVGSRTQWNISRDFYMGLDVFYTHLNTAYKGPGPGLYTGADALDDQGFLSAIFRVQYNFAP
jgi:hypothetical protein